MFESSSFSGALELNFFEKKEFERLDDLEGRAQLATIARNTLRLLMMGWTEEWTQLLTPTVAHAVLVQRNHQLLKEMRFAFQQGFEHVFEQLKDIKMNPEQLQQANLYILNCLNLLPYSDLTPYESIKIPQYINQDHWELVEYLVKPIELTPTTGISRIFYRDEDRVFAYGFEPFEQKTAPSHAVFMGTTYPAGQGVWTQVRNDLKGFETLGESVYLGGKERLLRWFALQKEVCVSGLSHGAGIALNIALNLGNLNNKISSIVAIKPAGVHDGWWKSQFDLWDELEEKPLVIVQKQGADPVSLFGTWKEEWTIIHIQAPDEKQSPNGFWDHALNYAGFKGAQFTHIDAKQDNLGRGPRNFWLYSLGRGFLYYGFLAPYTYVVRPLLHLIADNWRLVAFLTSVALLANFVFLGIATSLTLTLLLTLVIVTAVAVLSHAVTGNSVNEVTVLEEGEKVALAAMHHPQLPRNKTMDIYDSHNSHDVALTYKEINTYYKTMRSLKKKEFLPEEGKESKHVKGSKRALLEKSENGDCAEEAIPFHASKAKVAHIRRTLTLMEQLGSDNQEKLTQSLQENYDLYRIGKHSL